MPTTSTPTPTTEAPAARADIDLGALRHNLAVARRRAPGRRVMAVVKSLAYGHGLLPVARALADAADALAVARCEEGAALREAGIQTPLVVLEGFSSQAELGLARRHRLLPVLHDPRQLALLREATDPAPLPCWVKFDTGMHRLGFDWREADRVLAQLRAMPQLRIQGLMTHLANADDTADHTTAEQLRRLAAVPRDGLPLSVANSAGILGWPDSHADWVRPGLMLYGASPLQGRSAAQLGLRPVMTLSAPLIAIRPVRRGERVGYGGTWEAPEDMPLGVVAIGYGDGYPRHLGPEGQVLLHGRLAPVVGRVSMDMITIDLRGIDAAQVGDRVTLWGEGLPVDQVAAWADTIPYTLTCGVTERVARRYIDAAADE